MVPCNGVVFTAFRCFGKEVLYLPCPGDARRTKPRTQNIPEH